MNNGSFLRKNGAQIALGAGLLVVLSAFSSYNYLLFHTFIELFSITVACGIFIIGWNTRRLMNNGYFLFIAIAFLFVGVADLLHALTYKNMGVFQRNDPDVPTQLWIAARYLQGFSLILAPLFIKRKLRAELAVAVYAAVTALLIGSIFWGIFPDCFVEGTGLTPFKKYSEYLIALLLLGALVTLRRRQPVLDADVIRLLTIAFSLLIISELAFTLYVDVFGISNKVGHFLKIAGFFCIYKALIEIGLTRPFDLLFRELKKSEQALIRESNELRVSEEKFRLLAENAQDIIYQFRLLPTPHVEYVSPAATRITSYTPEEHYTNPQLAMKLVHQEGVSMFQEICRSPELYLTKPFCVSWQRKDGETRWTEHHNKLTYDSEGTLSLITGIGRDITERKRSEEKIEILNTELTAHAFELELSNHELQRVNAELAAANYELEAFNYTVSHDLRAPLTNISGFCQVLEQMYLPKLDEQGQYFVTTIAGETEKMNGLIRTLLNFSRLSRQELRRTEIDLSRMAQIVSLELQMNEPDRKVKFCITEGLHCHGDQALVGVVLQNLMGNAWKYTGKREQAEIEVGVAETTEGRRFYVRDNGAGFDEKQGEKLFHPFQRLHRNEEFEGCGIGLATVQRIIQRHGGHVTAEGEVGTGATFYFSLPEPVP